MSTEEIKYKMTVSLNVLKHLGFGLYSNIAAVLSEIVANSWDADAEHVSIDIDTTNGVVTIEDDGHGMTVHDANQKYLHVGYERRTHQGITPRFQRSVMGRKGIGKLSLFSIARTVELHSVKNSVTHGFVMDADAIEQIIHDSGEVDYHPQSVDEHEITLERGTRIVLTNMKRKLQWTGKPLRRRLARRFSILGPQFNFEIILDGEPVLITDREYQDKVQYIWTYGSTGNECRDSAKNCQIDEERPGLLDEDKGFAIDGWIGTAFESGHLKDQDTNESLNRIVVMVRGKLAKEDILEEFGEGGLYTKYIFGEIHADFLDLDTEEDIATTSRQNLIEEDSRYQLLRSKLQEELKHIQNQWTNLRNAQGAKTALAFPQVEEWFQDLDSDQKQAAQRLFGRINQLPIDDATDKRQLFVSGILAFESLKFRKMLHRLDEVSTENLASLSQVFIQLDDLEASAYYQIARDRLDVIRKLTDLVDENAREAAIQEHIHKHLWLLDPSWERATHTARMEQRIYNALDGVYDSLTDEQKLARLDIYYCTTGNRHVIIELKRANRVLDTDDVVSQVAKYYSAAENVLEVMDRGNEPLEIVCVVGRRLRDWDESLTGESRSRDMLKIQRARIVTYDQLIDNALEAYQDYVDGANEAGRVYRLIQGISEHDVQAISPT